MLRIGKDVDAALMGPDAALRADQITTGFFEIFSTVSNFQNSLFLIISDQTDPYCQGCGRGPDAARCGPPDDPNASFWLG